MSSIRHLIVCIQGVMTLTIVFSIRMPEDRGLRLALYEVGEAIDCQLLRSISDVLS